MKLNNKFKSNTFLNLLLALLVGIFCLSLFKNISYPLIWNDESEGVMLGVQILEYGYPKVHDGKNTIRSSYSHNTLHVGYKEKYDAMIGMNWGNYYWAAIGVYLAKHSDDIYIKTGLLRLPFTLVSLLGLVIFLFSVKKMFSEAIHFKIFAVIFVFIELFSISLVLHMREARYYSLVIFVCACFFYLYTNYFLYKRISLFKYTTYMTILLFFTYHVNFIICAILIGVLLTNIGIQFLINIFKTTEKNSFKNEFITAIKNSIGVVFALVLISPFFIFFEIAKTSAVISSAVDFTFHSYLQNLGSICTYLVKLEFAYTFIFLKILWLLITFYAYKTGNVTDNKQSGSINLMEKVSLFATSFFIIYALMIARTPWIFVRYYIVLQPLMVLILTIDFFIILNKIFFLQQKNVLVIKQYYIGAVVVFLFFNSLNKIEYIKSHIYEMTHQYKGVLDYTIPYIQQNFANPQDLIIATNYEEFAYMYYLKSKVIIGYVKNNLEEDLECVPDIIIYRKTVGTDSTVYNSFIHKAHYEKIVFPVYDYPVNNLPELDWLIKHQFRTYITEKDTEMTDMWVKK